MRTTLADKTTELENAKANNDREKTALQAKIDELETTLARERAEHIEVIHKLTQLIPSGPSS